MSLGTIPRILFRLVAAILIAFVAGGCLAAPATVDVTGFSNLVVEDNTLWFGAGYKLYRADLEHRNAAVVFDAKDAVITFVTVNGDQVVFGGYRPIGRDEGVMWMYSISRGVILWERTFRENWWGNAFVEPALIANEIVVAVTRTALYGVDVSSGDTRWRIEHDWLGDGESLMPVLENGHVLYAQPGEYVSELGSRANGTLYMVDVDTGEVTSLVSVAGTLGAIPAIHGQCLYVKDYQYYRRSSVGELDWASRLTLNCLDTRSGGSIWTFSRTGVPAPSRPAFHDGVVIDVFANRVVALDESTGSQVWEAGALEVAGRNPQIVRELGAVVVELPAAEKLVFLDLSSGELLGPVMEHVMTTPVFVGQNVVYGSFEDIAVADASSGAVTWSIPVDNHYRVYAPDD